MSINIKEDLTINEDLYGISDDESGEKGFHYYLRFALFAFAGFCFSQLDALGDMSPFTVSFLSALKFDYCFPVFIASSLGYFLSKPWQLALKYTVISAVICLVRLFAFRRMKESSTFFYITSFLSTAIMGTI